MSSVRTFARIFKNCKNFQNFNKNRNFSFQKCVFSTKDTNNELIESNKLGEIGSKYKVFQDEDSDIILDIYEEKLKYQHLLEENAEEEIDPFDGLNLESWLHSY